MNAEAEAAGATEISILSLEMELLFGVTRSRGRGRSVGQSCLEQAHDSRRVAKPDRGSRKTLDQAGAGAGFSGNPSKPVFPSAGLSSSLSSLPLGKPVLSPVPSSLGLHFLSPHSSAHDSKSAATSIHPSKIRPEKEGGLQSCLCSTVRRSPSVRLLSDAPGESWTGPRREWSSRRRESDCE